MTHDEFDINDLPAVLADRERSPEDTVPRRGMTVEALKALDKLAGTTEVTNGGHITFDEHDRPAGVTATETFNDPVGGFIFTRRLLDKLGVDPAELPNSTIIDNR